MATSSSASFGSSSISSNNNNNKGKSKGKKSRWQYEVWIHLLKVNAILKVTLLSLVIIVKLNI